MSTHYIEEAQRLADTVMIMSHGKAVAAGPPSQLVNEYAGSEVLEVYGPPREAGGGRRDRRLEGPADAAHGHERLDPRDRERRRDRDRRRAEAGEPRGRLRAPHRRGDRLMATATVPRAPSRQARAFGDHRRARPRDRQLLLLLARGDVLLDGRADDLPARVRLRVRLARQHASRATTTSTSSGRGSSRRRCSSRARSRRCSARSSSTSSSERTTRSSQRPSTRRSSSRRRRSGSPRGPVSTATCRSSSRWCSGSIPRGGCWRCRSSAGSPASAGRASGSRSPGSPSRSTTSATSSARS